MLLAKIYPAADIVKQISPFAHTSEIADYYTVYINRYVLEADDLLCDVVFGKINTEVSINTPQPDTFTILYSKQITLSAEDIATWGTDDKILLQVVAGKIGCNIVDYINI
jgi:hypothetical protein